MSDLRKQSDQGYGTTPYTGEMPNELEYEQEHQQFLRMPRKAVQSFGWVLRGANPKSLTLIDVDSITNALSAMGMSENHFNAYAVGTCDITSRWTLSVVVYQTNMDIETLLGVFKRWANNPTFKHWASPHMVEEGDEHRWPHRLELTSFKNPNGIDFSRDYGAYLQKSAADPGHGEMNKTPWKNTDDDYTTSIQIQDNDRGKTPGQGDSSVNEGPMTDLGVCTDCRKKFPDQKSLQEHILKEHVNEDGNTGKEYEFRDKGGINGDSYDNEGSRPPGDDILIQSSVEIDLEGPIPFSFDVEQDRLHIGNPGDESIKIDNNNPFGLAEGCYTPDGDLLITAQANIPYTVSHLMRMWENMNPEYKIKHVYIIRKDGETRIKEKLANA